MIELSAPQGARLEGPAKLATRTTPLRSVVLAALAEVSDPEIPGVSIVELGLVHRVDVGPGRIRVELLPTFVGCPALDVMRDAVGERLAEICPGADAEVRFTFDVPWTSDRITPEGREGLRERGFAPPVGDASAGALPVLPIAQCPYCGSRRAALENAFGPTPCRAIYYCADCRQPFEQFKSI
ncbi:MAG: ring,2-phenylacetyl-CoA epoxidase subunit PaaD [Chloroflexota bacterium]|nr:ring,2-phenylacetyl-CoA epoxidase subunit PaaD [Chloroflexota bacterium]